MCSLPVGIPENPEMGMNAIHKNRTEIKAHIDVTMESIVKNINDEERDYSKHIVVEPKGDVLVFLVFDCQFILKPEVNQGDTGWFCLYVREELPVGQYDPSRGEKFVFVKKWGIDKHGNIDGNTAGIDFFHLLMPVLYQSLVNTLNFRGGATSDSGPRISVL